MSMLAAPHVDDKTIDQLTECFQRLSLDDPQDDIRSESSFDPSEEGSLFTACSTFWAREMKRLIDELNSDSDQELDSDSDQELFSDSDRSYDPAEF